MSAGRLAGLGVLMLVVVWGAALYAVATTTYLEPPVSVVHDEMGTVVALLGDVVAAALWLLLVKAGVTA